MLYLFIFSEVFAILFYAFLWSIKGKSQLLSYLAYGLVVGFMSFFLVMFASIVFSFPDYVGGLIAIIYTIFMMRFGFISLFLERK
jgi:hypothetical protein